MSCVGGVQQSVSALRIIVIKEVKADQPKEGRKGQLFADLKHGMCEVCALVDTGDSYNFLRLEEAHRLGIEFEKTKS